MIGPFANCAARAFILSSLAVLLALVPVGVGKTLSSESAVPIPEFVLAAQRTGESSWRIEVLVTPRQIDRPMLTARLVLVFPQEGKLVTWERPLSFLSGSAMGKACCPMIESAGFWDDGDGDLGQNDFFLVFTIGPQYSLTDTMLVLEDGHAIGSAVLP